jgi:hypothetical protein
MAGATCSFFTATALPLEGPLGDYPDRLGVIASAVTRTGRGALKFRRGASGGGF